MPMDDNKHRKAALALADFLLGRGWTVTNAIGQRVASVDVAEQILAWQRGESPAHLPVRPS